jgi:hypothetical protein
MGELNLDRIERNFKNEAGLGLFQLTCKTPRKVQLVTCRPPATKACLDPSEKRHATRAAVHR